MKQYQLLIIAGLSIASTGLYSSEPKALEEESPEQKLKKEFFNSRYNSKKRPVTTGDIAGLIVGLPIHVSFFGHELGHAVVNKALTGNPVDIHLGAEWITFPKLMQKHIAQANTPFGKFTLHSGAPVGYFINTIQPKNLEETLDQLNKRYEAQLSPAKKIAINAAGPIAGAATGLAMRYMLYKGIEKINQSDMQESYKGKVSAPLKLWGALATLAIFENVLNLNPYMSGTDGSRIKKALEEIK